MSKLTITINTDNAAFEEPNCGLELARILQACSRKAEVQIDSSSHFTDALFDSNGNNVGFIRFRP